VALAVSAPAASASPVCDPTPIDLAFASRLCNGQPVTLELNFYQPLAAINGYATDVYVNVKNLSNCTIDYTAANPLLLDIQVHNNNVVNDSRRSITGIRSSWDDISVSRGNVTDYNVANQPVGSVSTSVVWNLSGPGDDTHTAGEEADVVFGFGDGLAGVRGRWNNYLTVTPRPFGLPAPPSRRPVRRTPPPAAPTTTRSWSSGSTADRSAGSPVAPRPALLTWLRGRPSIPAGSGTIPRSVAPGAPTASGETPLLTALGRPVPPPWDGAVLFSAAGGAGHSAWKLDSRCGNEHQAGSRAPVGSS